MPFLNCKILFFSIIVGLWSNSTCYAQNSILPEPSGNHTIGSTEFFINDTVIDKNNGQKVEKALYIKIWYPSDSIVSEENYNKYMQGYCQKELYSNFKLIGASRNEIADICNSLTYSKNNLPISNSNKKFPLIVFTPGCLFGLNDLYSSFTESLASNGYIVCSIVHIHDQICIEGEEGEDLTLDKGRVMRAFIQLKKTEFFTLKSVYKEKNEEYVTRKTMRKLTRFNQMISHWEEGTLLALDVLKQKSIDNSLSIYHKIDFDNIGTMGHSLGGALSNHLCATHKEIKAGVNLDCFQFGNVVDSKTEKPLMLIEGDFMKKWCIGNKYVYNDIENLEYLQFKNSMHFMFCDLPFYDGLIAPQKMKMYIGGVDGKFAITKINDFVLSFFNKNLKKEEESKNRLTNYPPSVVSYPINEN